MYAISMHHCTHDFIVFHLCFEIDYILEERFYIVVASCQAFSFHWYYLAFYF